jgi:hypothetical protein
MTSAIRDPRTGIVELLVPRGALLYGLGLFLPLAIDVSVGFRSRSTLQLLGLFFTAALFCEIGFLWLDWISGRFLYAWWRENSITYPRMLFFSFALPAACVALGGLLALLKRRLFALRTQHA